MRSSAPSHAHLCAATHTHRRSSAFPLYLAVGDAALGDESACAFKRWTHEDEEHPGPVHIVTTKTRRSRPGVVVHQTRSLPSDDVLTYERLLRVTDDARTLIDRADRCTFRELRGLADHLRRLPVAQLEAMAEDKRRDRRYRRAGWTPIRVMWEELEPADREVAGELAEELGLGPLSRRRASAARRAAAR